MRTGLVFPQGMNSPNPNPSPNYSCRNRAHSRYNDISNMFSPTELLVILDKIVARIWCKHFGLRKITKCKKEGGSRNTCAAQRRMLEIAMASETIGKMDWRIMPIRAGPVSNGNYTFSLRKHGEKKPTTVDASSNSLTGFGGWSKSTGCSGCFHTRIHFQFDQLSWERD